MEIFFPFFNFKGDQILRQKYWKEKKKKKKLLKTTTTTTTMVTYIHTLVYGMLMDCRNLNSCIIMRNRMLKEILVFSEPVFFSFKKNQIVFLSGMKEHK
jgi:hypothetical protein